MSTSDDCRAQDETGPALAELRSRTRNLRQAAYDLAQRLTGPTCSTLRLLLLEQSDELRQAEGDLPSPSEATADQGSQERRSDAFATALEGAGPVNERVLALVDGHEAASTVARRVGRRAHASGDLALHALLVRHADAHDEAACMLAPLALTSILSCAMCEARQTCSLSAARDRGKSPD